MTSRPPQFLLNIGTGNKQYTNDSLIITFSATDRDEFFRFFWPVFFPAIKFFFPTQYPQYLLKVQLRTVARATQLLNNDIMLIIIIPQPHQQIMQSQTNRGLQLAMHCSYNCHVCNILTVLLEYTDLSFSVANIWEGFPTLDLVHTILQCSTLS